MHIIHSLDSRSRDLFQNFISTFEITKSRRASHDSTSFPPSPHIRVSGRLDRARTSCTFEWRNVLCYMLHVSYHTSVCTEGDTGRTFLPPYHDAYPYTYSNTGDLVLGAGAYPLLRLQTPGAQATIRYTLPYESPENITAL